jgi:ABC-type transport system involved in multi-copper enzyme maturation permease subunit
MIPQLRSELLKHRSTRTSLGLFAGMLGLVVFAVVLHAFSLPVDRVDGRTDQLSMVFGWGQALGALFAGLFGAMSITGEYRHGTIRSTFLVSPRRMRVVAAKAGAGALGGMAFGVAAQAVAMGVAAWALSARGGVANQLDGGDYALLLAGALAGGALWAVLGLGVGAVVRNQVPALVGICAWLLFVENLLVSNVPDAGRFAPGAAAGALAGRDPDVLLAPAVGAVLLAVYTVGLLVAGWLSTERRDVA